MKHIELGGQRRPVHFNVNALIEFDEITGLDVTAGVLYVEIRKLKNQRALAYVGLKYGALEEKQQFNLSLAEVGDLMDLKGKAAMAIMEAFNHDMGVVSEEDEQVEAEVKKKQVGES